MSSTDSTGTQHETLLFAHFGILKRTYTLLLSSQPQAIFLAHKYTGKPRDLLAPIGASRCRLANGGPTADPETNLFLSSSPSQL